jgi:hypothetical protein
MSLPTDFKKFLLRGNVLDLAVAVVVGTAFTAVVKALVSDLLTPILALHRNPARRENRRPGDRARPRGPTLCLYAGALGLRRLGGALGLD